MAELKKLGRYELRRVLGKGAMGVVYEGFDPTLGRRVAVKTILRSVAIDEETAASYSERFVKEAKAVGRLNHPHIVQVHDFGEENEVAYLVMEFIEGRELRAFFDAGEKFELGEAVRIMGELLDALDFAHDRGVIHRDIKPANVMLDERRRVKLADFGVARLQDSDRSAAGTMVGTPAFMSPEQIKGGKIDGRTDIFSAGNILYQMLTGEQPFKGEGAWTVAKKIVDEDPPAPSSVVRSVSPAFDAVVDKALAKLPPQRYAKAGDFAAALRAAHANPTQAAPAAPPTRVATDTKASETELEFWRSIQNRDDLDELELYVEQFPNGAYTKLAKLKIAKLREPLEAAKKAAEEKARHAAEAQAKREAEESAQREAEEAAARKAAEEKARKEAEEKARREAEAKARREAEEKVRREAEDKARRAAEEKARKEAAEKAKREAVEKERQAKALAKLKAEEEARAKAAAAAVPVDDDATVAVRSATAESRRYVVPSVIAVVVAAVAIGAFFAMQREPVQVEVKTQEIVKPPVVDVEKIRRETEERIRKEHADKSEAERQAATKAAFEKEVAEKKQAAEKAKAEMLAAAKAAKEKADQEAAAAKAVAALKSVQEKAAVEKAVAAEKAAAEKAAAEKMAAEKAAAEKLAAARAAPPAPVAAASRRPGWPAVGDRWSYLVQQVGGPGSRFSAEFEVAAVSANEILETASARYSGGSHKPGGVLRTVGPGLMSFSPYVAAFGELREGAVWKDVDYGASGGSCSNNPSFSCAANAKVLGRESVTVKAGTFNAWKVQVELYATGSGSSSLRVIDYWYADEVHRFVKIRDRHRNASNWRYTEWDVELGSYTPAGSR